MSEEDKLIEQIAQTYRDVVGPVPLAQRLPELLQELQPSEQIIWVMDSELCDECGWLLGYFGECTNPGCITWEGWTAWDEEEENDPYADSGDYDERAYLMGEYDDELEGAQKRVHELFYQKLAERHPDSPWLKEK